MPGPKSQILDDEIAARTFGGRRFARLRSFGHIAFAKSFLTFLSGKVKSFHRAKVLDALLEKTIAPSAIPQQIASPATYLYQGRDNQLVL